MSSHAAGYRTQMIVPAVVIWSARARNMLLQDGFQESPGAQPIRANLATGRGEAEQEEGENAEVHQGSTDSGTRAGGSVAGPSVGDMARRTLQDE